MGGGGQTQSSGPPRWMVPYIQNVLNQGQNLYDNYTPQYFPGSTVAPQSGYTQSAISQYGNYGSSPTNQAAVGAATGSLGTLAGASDAGNNPLLAAGQQTVPGSVAAINTATQNPGATAAGTLAGATGANTANAVNSALTAQPGSNPWVDEMVSRALAQNTRNFTQTALPAIDNAAQMAGGYGGTRQGVAQGVALQGLADANATTAANLYSSQYNTDADRALNAAGLGANIANAGTQAGLTQTGQGLTAANLGLSTLGSGYTSGLDAAKAAGVLAPGVQQIGLGGANAAAAAGTATDQYQQALVQDALNRWNYQQDLPYNKLNEYANLVMGGSGSGGTVTSASGGGSPVAGALGGAAAGAGLTTAGIGAGMTSLGTATSWSPWGWALMAGGALLGYLGSK